jgi:RHS repeat-associated protein
MNARYYNPDVGRFISVDPAFLAIGDNEKVQGYLSDPQSLNSYTYARNNPIVYLDPNGESAQYFKDYAKSYGEAVIQGAADFAKQGFNFLVDSLFDPMGTLQKIGDPIVDSLTNGTVSDGITAAKSFALDFVQNPSQTYNRVLDKAAMDLGKLADKSPSEQGRIVGGVVVKIDTGIVVHKIGGWPGTILNKTLKAGEGSRKHSPNSSKTNQTQSNDSRKTNPQSPTVSQPDEEKPNGKAQEERRARVR